MAQVKSHDQEMEVVLLLPLEGTKAVLPIDQVEIQILEAVEIQILEAVVLELLLVAEQRKGMVLQKDRVRSRSLEEVVACLLLP